MHAYVARLIMFLNCQISMNAIATRVMPMQNVQISMVPLDATVNQVMRAQDFCVLVNLFIIIMIVISRLKLVPLQML